MTHDAPKLRVAFVLGSTRPGRNGEQVAKWALDLARQRTDAEYELVDLKEFPLPHLDEPMPPSMGKYTKAHTKAWAEKISSFDAFVFVTPEYNHGPSGVLKNAIDYLYAEWNNKAAGFISYGSAGGVRAVEHLRLVMAELQVATVRAQVWFSLQTDFENYSVLKATPPKAQQLGAMLDQLVAWGTALRGVRVPDLAPGSASGLAEATA